MISLVLVVAVTAAPVVVSGGPENDYESWILRLSDNRLMVIFDRNPDWASGDLYVTFSDDDGATWDPPVAIIEQTGDQATLSFVQLPSGTLQVWYASNEVGTYSIYTARSADGITWTQGGSIDLGWQSGVTHYDPTVILEPDSSLTMSYVVQGMGGYIAHCPHGGNWDTLKTLVGTSGYRTRVMKHTNGTYLYAYHRKSGPGQYDYDVFIRTSPDRVHWADSVRLTSNLNSHDPFPNEAPDGAYLVYYAKYQSPAYNLHRRRSYDAISWEPEEQITSDPTNNTQPHFFCESGQIFLVWAHCVSYPLDHDVYFERFTYAAVKEKPARARISSLSMNISRNPCTHKALITVYPVPGGGNVILRIFDATGRLLRSFPVRTPHAPVTLSWDGTAASGRVVPTGVYCIQAHQVNRCCARTLLFIR
jgi:hypothetical protein